MESMKNSVSKTYDSYFTSAADMYEKTVGYVNDDAAKMALDKSKQKDKMYTRNEHLGLLSEKNTADAAATSFMLADLYRFNVAPNDDNPDQFEQLAAEQYAAALRRIALNPLGAVNAVDIHMPPAEFMIDRAEDFYEDYVVRQTLQDADPAERFVMPTIQEIAQLRDDVRNARVVAAGNAATENRKPKRATRRARRGEKLTEKQLVQDNYFGERDIRNDPQNVHETQVNKDMVRIYRNIQYRNDQNMENAMPQTSIEELRDYAKRHNFGSPEKQRRALQTINKMAEGNFISTLNAKENEILGNVWNRVNSAENMENRDGLRSSLMDSLSECVERGYNGGDYQVCASGRTARVLGAMTLLDTNESISTPMKTAEILRNEVFSKSYKIIQDALKETDDETARGYNGALESPAPDVEYKVGQFVEAVKGRIAETLRADYADVDPGVIDNLIKDAQAGV